MNGDDVAVLHAQVVANDSVYPGAAIVEVVIGKNDQNGVFSLLALDKDCVTAEQLQSLHGVVGEGDNRVIIIDGICHAIQTR